MALLSQIFGIWFLTLYLASNSTSSSILSTAWQRNLYGRLSATFCQKEQGISCFIRTISKIRKKDY